MWNLHVNNWLSKTRRSDFHPLKISIWNYRKNRNCCQCNVQISIHWKSQSEIIEKTAIAANATTGLGASTPCVFSLAPSPNPWALHNHQAGADMEIPLVESSLITHFRDAKYYGSTALIAASFFDWPAAVRVLLDAGANPDAKTLQNQTALDVATSSECRMLLKPVTGQRSGVYTK